MRVILCVYCVTSGRIGKESDDVDGNVERTDEDCL